MTKQEMIERLKEITSNTEIDLVNHPSTLREEWRKELSENSFFNKLIAEVIAQTIIGIYDDNKMSLAIKNSSLDV